MKGQHTPRNQNTNHGHTKYNPIDSDMALYVINMATANMLYIVKASKKTDKDNVGIEDSKEATVNAFSG